MIEEGVVKKLKLDAPWIIWCNEIRALFSDDPDVIVRLSDDERKIDVIVHGAGKYHAISKLLPTKKVFGNVEIELQVLMNEETVEDIFRDAFAGNPIMERVFTTEAPGGGLFTYVKFNSVPKFFFADNLQDDRGMIAILPADIAEHVLVRETGTMFSTEMPEEVCYE